jgi:hypothetical protein
MISVNPVIRYKNAGVPNLSQLLELRKFRPLVQKAACSAVSFRGALCSSSQEGEHGKNIQCSACRR